MKFLTPYRRGLLLTILGVLFITPDSLLILMSGQSSANLMFFRNGMMVLLFLPLVFIYRHQVFGKKTSLAKTPAMLWAKIKEFYPITLIYPATSFCFILGTQYGTVASNLIILSSAPLIGALITALYLKKKVPLDNWLATIGIFLGIALVMADNLREAKLFGSLCSFGAAFFLAMYYSFLQTVKQHPHPLLVVLLLAGSNSFFSLPFVSWGTTTSAQMGLMFINALLTTALSFSLTSYAARFVSSEETLLIFMLETLIGPLLVWWVLGQSPLPQTILGGIIVLLVVSIWTLRKMQQPKMPARRA